MRGGSGEKESFVLHLLDVEIELAVGYLHGARPHRAHGGEVERSGYVARGPACDDNGAAIGNVRSAVIRIPHDDLTTHHIIGTGLGNTLIEADRDRLLVHTCSGNARHLHLRGVDRSGRSISGPGRTSDRGSHTGRARRTTIRAAFAASEYDDGKNGSKK